MFISERTIVEAETMDAHVASEVGWFAAKQPGLLRFLQDRLGDGDALALGVDLGWRVVGAFERQNGRPIPRLDGAELERAEEEVVAESRGLNPLASGCAHRQPELCAWLEASLRAVTLPIDRALLDGIALCVAATISACDRAHLPEAAGFESLGPLLS